MSRIKNLKCLSDKIVSDIAHTVDSFLKTKTVVPLGPAYSTMPIADIDENLRLHRATKKWEIPSAANSTLRRETSIRAMLKSDAEGLTAFITDGQDPYTVQQINLMRFELQRVLKRHYRFRTDKLRMPKGETFVSAGGDVSVVAKMRDVDQWCVTSDCFELAARVIYDVPALKRCARSHFVKYSRREIKRLNTALSNSPDVGFEVFKCRLLDFVTIVDGMRLETVPKDNSKDRVIGCEPLLNMLVQSCVEEGIRHVILVHYGIDLKTSQSLHHLLIADEDNATIDFANASNSSYMCFLDWCLKGTDLHSNMVASRSPVAIYDGMSHNLNMVSPMGNGFTFGYMTLIILALSRQYDSFSHVFGDDLIIDRHVVPQCLEALSLIGYQVNETKSFIEGHFFESCGAFWSIDHYILSYDFEYPTDLVSAIVLTNKIGIYAQQCGGAWVALHRKLLSFVPPYLYGWHEWQPAGVIPDSSNVGIVDEALVEFTFKPQSGPPDYDIPSSYFVVYTRGAMRKKRYDPVSRELWKNKTSKESSELQKIQYLPSEVSLLIHVEYEVSTYRHAPQDNVTPPWIAYYLFSGRCIAPSRRTPSFKRKIRTRSELIPYWSGAVNET